MLLLKNFYTLQHIFAPQKVIAALSLMTLAGSWVPIYNMTRAAEKIVYPIQEMSEIDCRFQKFSELTSDCKRQLPILETSDYSKYVKQDGGYNDYTRIYTVLWGSSYKYWWDVWNGWHGGTDIATAEWTPVYSIAEGTVLHAKYMPGWGNNVSIEHEIDGKKIVSNYSHLHTIDTTVGKTVKAGTKIWEVGNTGNSFWNHLHFQIDLDTPFHPYYYDYAKCPYSFSQISESDICFDELAKNTIDPLAFLESKWAILDKVSYVATSTSRLDSSTSTQTTTSTKTTSSSSSSSLPNILYTYVHVDSEEEDIEELQEILKEMWIYEGRISGNYTDIKQVLIAYQIDRWVIEDKDSVWAWYFWPKTRAVVQEDYKAYLDGADFDNPIEFTTSRLWWDTTSDAVENKETPEIENNIKIEKIERTEILTREEIEQREVNEFKRNYDIDLKFDGSLGNIGLWITENIVFTINKANGRPFKGTTPGNITIETDESMVRVFPNSFYSFTNGKRDIGITGLKEWVTALTVKMWEIELKKFDIKVFNGELKIVPQYGSVFTEKKIVFWEEKTGIVVLKDDNYRDLVNLRYEGEYILTSDTDTQFCKKTTDLIGIYDAIKDECSPEEYTDEIQFSYNDTAGWILLFDYKVSDWNASMKLLNKATNTELSERKLLVTNPKWLDDSYEYTGEVLALLEKWIVDGISKGYFLEERQLTQYDAYNWINNTLVVLKNNADSAGKKAQIQDRIDVISRINTSKTSYLSRRDFLSAATEALVFDDVIPEVTIEYKDLDDLENRIANLAFDSNNTWKDKFWENYYRPKEKISRGEAAYLISRVLEKKTSSFVTLNK
jgi:hypothetical protein